MGYWQRRLMKDIYPGHEIKIYEDSKTTYFVVEKNSDNSIDIICIDVMCSIVAEDLSQLFVWIDL